MKAFEFTTPFKAGQTLRIGLFSDIHFDSPDCDRIQLKKDLDYCIKNNIYIVINGDLCDAILLKDQKRAVNHLMEKEDNQLNIKVNNLVEFLRPYQNNILFIGRGNHEESVLKYSGLDIIEIITQILNAGQSHQIQYGNYANFLRFSFTDTRKKTVAHYDIFAHHGAGGSAPATKGMLDFNAIAKGTMADLIWIGHKHQAISDFSTPVMYVDKSGVVQIRNRQCIQTPSYQKGRTIDYNVNFAERFYNHQAMSGFGMVELTPNYELDPEGTKKPKLHSEIRMMIKPKAQLGQVQSRKLPLERKRKLLERYNQNQR